MGIQLGETIWERRGSPNHLTMPVYMLAVAGFTILGLLISVLVALATMQWHTSWLLVIGLWFIFPFLGIYIAVKSDSWFVSLIGYVLVVAGIGAGTGPTVAMSGSGIALVALGATLGVTILASAIGMTYPRALQHWGAYLFGALIALLCVRIAQGVMAGLGVMEHQWYVPWLEYGTAMIFSLYIIFDWNRARSLPRTLDNAVDCSLAIYLDVINVFLSLFRTTRAWMRRR